jgi:deoxyribodipyrimidine photo-lyase
MRRSIIWFRRDLRISDHPALNAAIESADEIIPVFIVDPNQSKQSGAKQMAYLMS